MDRQYPLAMCAKKLIKTVVRGFLVGILLTWAFLANADTVNDPIETKSYNENYVVAQYVEYVKPPIVHKVVSGYCSCVQYVKAKLGISGSLGNAWNIVPNSQVPTIGSIVLTYEGRGHAALVVGITDKYIIIDESNYVRCTQTLGRQIPIDSPLIRGYLIIR